MVLEREIAGFGASGRNGGWVSAGISGSASVYRRRAGDDAVRRALRETYHAVGEIGAVAAAEGIDCGFASAGGLTVAQSEPQQARLEARVQGLRAQGASPDDVRLLSPAEAAAYVHVRGCLAASYTPHCARIDPARLVRGLADACERLGVTIFERTEALEISPGRIRTSGGNVRSEVVLVATEAYTPGRRFLPLYSLMIATEPLPAEVWEELAWKEGLLISDCKHLFFYAQPTTDGRIAIGGRGAPYTWGEPISTLHERSPEVRERLARSLQRSFPAAETARITHHWGGPLGVPRDWCMTVS